MKTCEHCGASNSNLVGYCGECGEALTTLASPPPDQNRNPSPQQRPFAPPQQQASSPAASVAAPQKPDNLPPVDALNEQLQRIRNAQRADIMFVLDCTDSMSAEIDTIRDAIISFSRTIRTDGVQARVGLIEFRDRWEGEAQRVVLFDGHPFTEDPELFSREAAKLSAEGGGDIPESSLDALRLALRQPFAPGVKKVIVLITDAPPHLPDVETKSIEEVIAEMKEVGINQLYPVIRVADPKSKDVYQMLAAGVRDQYQAFNLGEGGDFRRRAEHFKRMLMSLGKTISQATR